MNEEITHLKAKIHDLKLFYSGLIETMKKKEKGLEDVNLELIEVCKAQEHIIESQKVMLDKLYKENRWKSPIDWLLSKLRRTNERK